MEQILKEILNGINDLKEEQIKTNERLTNLETKVDNLELGQKEIKNRIDNISDNLGSVITKEIGDEISEIKTDVKFITRKVQDTEKDVFGIKDQLKLIK